MKKIVFVLVSLVVIFSVFAVSCFAITYSTTSCITYSSPTPVDCRVYFDWPDVSGNTYKRGWYCFNDMTSVIAPTAEGIFRDDNQNVEYGREDGVTSIYVSYSRDLRTVDTYGEYRSLISSVRFNGAYETDWPRDFNRVRFSGDNFAFTLNAGVDTTSPLVYVTAPNISSSASPRWQCSLSVLGRNVVSGDWGIYSSTSTYSNGSFTAPVVDYDFRHYSVWRDVNGNIVNLDNISLSFNGYVFVSHYTTYLLFYNVNSNADITSVSPVETLDVVSRVWDASIINSAYHNVSRDFLNACNLPVRSYDFLGGLFNSLTNALDSFLSFEVFPGFPLSTILSIGFSLGLLFIFLRFFAGG